MSSLSKTLEGVSGKLEGLVSRAEELANAVEPQRVTNIVQNVDTISQNLATATKDMKPLLDEFKVVASNLSKAGEATNTTLAKVDGLISSVDPDQVKQTMDNISVASAQAREGIANLTEVSETIGNRNEDIDQIIQNTRQLTASLNDAAQKVQVTLGKLDGVLGSSDTQGLIAEANKAVKSFQQVADKVNKQIGPIMNNLERFSGPGLRDFDALVAEARRSITRIERTVSQIGDDPQSLIFGGSGGVKQYDGRRRR